MLETRAQKASWSFDSDILLMHTERRAPRDSLLEMGCKNRLKAAKRGSRRTEASTVNSCGGGTAMSRNNCRHKNSAHTPLFSGACWEEVCARRLGRCAGTQQAQKTKTQRRRKERRVTPRFRSVETLTCGSQNKCGVLKKTAGKKTTSHFLFFRGGRGKKSQL